MTEMPSDAAIVSARFLEPLSPEAVIEPPTMTARSGSTHGAIAVRTPAMNETKSKNMVQV